VRWTGRASGEAPCLSPGPPVHGARHSSCFVTPQLPASSPLSFVTRRRFPLFVTRCPTPLVIHRPRVTSPGQARPAPPLLLIRRQMRRIHFSLVIRRSLFSSSAGQDRRIQRTVETTSSIGDDGPAGWIRRINRRMTQEGASHPPLLPFFVIRRLDRRIQRNVKTTPVPEMFLCQLDSPDKPANDDPVIGDQSSVIRTESSERCRWGRWPSHAFPSPITDHCPLITDHRHLITGPSPDGLIGGSSRKGGLCTPLVVRAFLKTED